MQYQITDDRILLKKIEPFRVSVGGIYIPDAVVDSSLPTDRGRVIDTGPGRTTKTGTIIPVEVAKDDVVVYAQNAGTPIKIDGDDYLLIKEEDVIGIEY